METNTLATETTSQTLGFFGTGRYSKMGAELFRDSQRVLGITEIQADKLARAFMADWGRCQMQVESCKVGNNKKNSDGVTLKEMAQAKEVTLTNPLTIARLVAKMDECRKYGISKYVEVKLIEPLAEYLAGLK